MTDAALPDLEGWSTCCAADGLDAVAVLAGCLTRIAKDDPAINAVVALDRDGARRAAENSVERWRSGAPLSAIDGAPVLVKASFAVAGLPWHGGVAAYADRIAAADAVAVARLRAAGAVVLGLTNMDEGALGAAGDNPWLGRIGNPDRPSYSAGGSSGGSAAAVAAGFCLAALGSDTIGSIAIPAACCGVVGHRASRSLLPVDGVMPLSPSFDHAGWHVRSIGDALALRRAIGPAAAPHGALRVAALDVDYGADMVTGIDRIAPPPAICDIARRLFEVAEAEGAVLHAQVLRDRPDGVSSGFRRMLDWGATTGRDRRDGHLAALRHIAEAIRASLSGYDALLLPAAPNVGFAAGSPAPHDLATFAAIPACLGWPATTIPPRVTGGRALLVTAPSDHLCLSVAARL